MLLAALATHAHGTATRVSILNRVVSKLIDLAIVLLLVGFLYPVGPLLGFLYSLCADGISVGGLQGQSIGKKLLKLQVIHTPTRRPASIRDSVLRNAPVGVATFFGI